MKLGGDIIGCRQVTGDFCEGLGFVVTLLLVQRLGEQAGGRRSIVLLAHLLEGFVVATELCLGGARVSGHQLHGPGVERRECGVELHPELFKDRPAALVELSSEVGVATHRLEVREEAEDDRFGLAIAGGGNQQFFASRDRFGDRFVQTVVPVVLCRRAATRSRGRQ